MSYQQPPPSDEPTPAGSAPPPPPPQEPAAPPPPPPADPAPAYQQPPAAPSGGARSSGMTADELRSTVQNANQYDLGIIAAGVLAFLLSFFPFYKASVSSSGSLSGLDAFGSQSGTWSAWHGFFGWFAALVALAAAVLLVLSLLGIHLLDATMTRLAVLGGFAVALLCTILALFISPLPGSEGKESFGGVTVEYSKGVGWAYWVFLLVIIVGAVLAFLRKDATD
jgi:hypothetical protein